MKQKELSSKQFAVSKDLNMKVNTFHLMNAKLNLLTYHLKNFSMFKSHIEHLSKKTSAYQKQLIDSREKLLKSVQMSKIIQKQDDKNNILNNKKLIDTLDNISQFITGWDTMSATQMAEGISETPR